VSAIAETGESEDDVNIRDGFSNSRHQHHARHSHKHHKSEGSGANGSNSGPTAPGIADPFWDTNGSTHQPFSVDV
jgi:hypothetical protein